MRLDIKIKKACHIKFANTKINISLHPTVDLFLYGKFLSLSFELNRKSLFLCFCISEIP